MTEETKGQATLFEDADLPEDWKEHWKGMPEFIQEDLAPFRTIYVHFESAADVKAFAKLVGQNISPETKFLWYPKPDEKLCTVDKVWVDE